MNRLPLFRRADVIPMIVSLVAAAIWIGMALSAANGQRLYVRTEQGEQVYALTENTSFTVVGKNGITLDVVIEDGAAYVAAANCPDQVCVHTGKLTRDGQTAACMPAQVLLSVRGGDTASTDAVAR